MNSLIRDLLMAAVVMVLVGIVYEAVAAPFAKFPCQTGTPLPTECRCAVAGTTKPTEAPVTSGTETACYADLAGQSGTAVSVSCIAANAWGAAAARIGTADLTTTLPPAQLGPMILVPTKP